MPPLRAALRGRRSPRGTRGAAGLTPPCVTEADRGAAISQTTAAYGTTRRRSRRGGREREEAKRLEAAPAAGPYPAGRSSSGGAAPLPFLAPPNHVPPAAACAGPDAPRPGARPRGLLPFALPGWVGEKGAAPEVLLYPYAWEMPAPLLGAVPCWASPAVRPPRSGRRSHPHFSGSGISDHVTRGLQFLRFKTCTFYIRLASLRITESLRLEKIYKIQSNRQPITR